MERTLNDEFLLQCVSNYKPLYDKSDKGYKSILQKKNCWASVARSLDCSVTEVKSRFKSLREKYRREVHVEKLERSGAAASIRPVWPLMSFFKFMYKCGNETQRATTSNIHDESFKLQDSGPYENPDSQSELDEKDCPYDPDIFSQSNGQIVTPERCNIRIPNSSCHSNPTETNQSKRRKIYQHEETNDAFQMNPMNEPTTVSTSTSSNPVSKRKKKYGGETSNLSTQIKEIDNVLVGVSAAINNNINDQKKVISVDRYDLFSQYIASELKYLGEPHAEILMEEIQLIFINYKRELRADDSSIQEACL